MAVSNLLTISLFGLLDLVAASLTSTGQTLLLNDIPYYVPANPFTTVPPLTSLHTLHFAGGLVPVTVVGVSASNSSLSTVESIINEFGKDDVWNEGFLKVSASRSSDTGEPIIPVRVGLSSRSYPYPTPSLACEVMKSGLSSLVFSMFSLCQNSRKSVQSAYQNF